MFFIPWPSSSAPAFCKLQCLSTEINCSLTQTKNLQIRRESTIKVESDPTPRSLSLPTLDFFPHRHPFLPLSSFNQLVNLFLPYIRLHGAAETGSLLTDLVGARVEPELPTKCFPAAPSAVILLDALEAMEAICHKNGVTNHPKLALLILFH